jgi:DNA-binding CsgD family transcriptional regulator
VNAVGRDRELEAISSFLDSRSGAPVLVLDGEAGIGKTVVWRVAVARARERGTEVVACVASEPESRLSYVGLGDVLEPIAARALDGLAPPQRRALEVALLLRDPGDRPPDGRAVAVAALAALRAAPRPLLVAIDDVQWLDRASSEALGYCFRRIAEAADIHVLLARRAGSEGGLEPGRDVQRLQIGPLSVGAIRRIVALELGATLARPALVRVHAASGGNPLYALELARAELSHDRAWTHGRTPTLVELAQRRCAALPPQTRDALLLLSAAPDPTPGSLSTALGSDALEVLRPALDASLVELTEGRVRFSHPVLASAIRASTPEHAYRDAHARLAVGATSVEEQGHHLALATIEPDEDVAVIVELAASTAQGRGARADAAELFERAAELTQMENTDGRGRRLVLAADAYFQSGDAVRARSLIEQAAELEGAARAQALWRLGRILDETEGFDRSRSQWEEALETDDLRLIVDVRRSMAYAALFVDGETSVSDAVAGVEAAERLGEATPLALALAMEAYVRGVLGDPRYREPLERALRLESDVVLDELHSPSAVLADLGRLTLDLDASRRGFEAVLRHAEEVGDARSETWGAYGLGMVEALAGDLPRAAELARRATELSEQVTLLGLPAVRLTAFVEACCGQVARCRELLDACYATARQMGDRVNLLGTLAIDGFLEISLGAPTEALEPLAEARTIQGELGLREPGVTRFLVDLAEALAAAGRVDEAEEALAAFAAQAEQLGREWARPLIARARGQLLAARGDVEGSLQQLQAAVAEEELLPMPLERARTLLGLGSAQRRARHRRAARGTLERALAMFDDLGTPLWTAKARAELGRVGGRTSSPSGLTQTEQQVAALVAQGKSNKEVATALVLSVHTIEAALTSIYRKLDVHSRTEMARRLTEVEASLLEH